MGRLDERVAIVTGGGRGIGRAIADAYAHEGARVFIVDRDPDRTHAAAVSITGAAAPVGWFAGDVGDEARVAEIVAAVLETAGRIDVLVNNAAIQHEATLLDQTVEQFHAIVNTNLLGTFLYSRAVLPSMLAQGAGVIVNLSSVLGLVGDAMLPVYSATKHAILGLTKSTAIAYASKGIRCVAICPGDVDTELNQVYFASQPDPVAFRGRIEREYPQRRMSQPAEIARVAVFLATDDATGLNGSHVLVDGGILSRLYDVYEEPA
ncbi:MAG TPA: SDR family oxidoreductase [Candidatus Limnocylindrales bacterium]|nr:SDR family oxidoreductase [Candidatus Limnocylindrales bacterium]